TAKRVTNFAEVARRFSEMEVVPARYDDEGRKIAGRRSLDAFSRHIEVLTEYFGNLDLQSITYGDLEDFKALRLKTPVKFKSGRQRPRSIRSVNYELTVLKQIFNFAYRRRWLDRSPFDDGRGLINKAAETRRNKTWTRAEERQALALCTCKKYAHMKPAIICAVDGGFRRGELLHSLWSETSFENGTMIARSYKGKTLHKRTVYMTKRMMAALIEWKILQKKIKTIKDTSLVIGYDNLQSAWETLREKINRPDLHFHDLRHVFGTRLNQSQKISLREIQLLLGHSDIRTTQLYLNPSEENLKESIKVLEED
ncbi:MAG TPA: site-specific integrase, partial [Pyrinomonadaceae bacterium]